MITFQEWLEKNDPQTYNEFKFMDRFKKQSNARPFNDEERRKLALLQNKEKEKKVLDYKNSKPQNDPEEIKWRG